MQNEETRIPSILLDAMPAAGADGLVEIPIAVLGKWKGGEREFAITREDLAQMTSNFAKRKNGEINVDYEHASELPEMAKGGPVPSAGRIVALRIQDSGFRIQPALMAKLDFTARALEMVKNREYRFVSPAIGFNVKDKVSGEVQGTTLTSLALTNRPFLEELPPIKLSEIQSADFAEGADKKTLPRQSVKSAKSVDRGGVMEPLTATKLSEGKFQIVRGAEVLGAVEIEQPAAPKPEEIIATFSEEIGAKGKTREEVKGLVEAAGAFRAREASTAAHKLLASECVKDGKLDRERMKVLARESKVGMEDFLAFEDAFGAVDEAVRAGKILPKHRDGFMAQALSDAKAFKALAADLPRVVPVSPTGIAGDGNVKDVPANVDPESIKLRDRARVLMTEQKIDFGRALEMARHEKQ